MKIHPLEKKPIVINKKEFGAMKRWPNRRNRGFALVVTLMMLILLTLLVVGMLSLSSVALRSSNRSSAQAEAHANARMGLMIAIGELQKSMGPDTRISAHAGVLARDPRIGLNPAPNTAKAWWLGVSSSDPTQGVGSSAGNPVVWLLSGLEKSDSSGGQLTGSFEDPVVMYGENSINTPLLTGGEPIRAGMVDVTNGASGRPGAYAWFVEDDGMKAQLAASNPGLRNDLAEQPGGGLLPGTYDIGILENMDAVAGRDPDEISRLGLTSINSLPFLGASKDIARDKRFSYTTRSQSVLSDVKNGGLKKDLTIAFERDDVFTAIFGDGVPLGRMIGNVPMPNDADFEAKYIVMDEDKFNSSSDLQRNGYIHWEMLKDFYNIKRNIDTSGGREFLPASAFRNNGLGYSEGGNPYRDSNFRFYNGRLGPHEIGNNSDAMKTVPFQAGLPYGNYLNLQNQTLLPQQEYMHSPVSSIMMHFQQNAWLSLQPPPPAPGEYLRTNVQIWLAQYNPYNIWLNDGTAYCRGFSTVDFDHPGLMVRRWPDGYKHGNTTKPEWEKVPLTSTNNSDFKGFLYRTQVTSSNSILLGPGRSHVLGIQRDTDNETENKGGYYLSGTFGDDVANLLFESSLMDRPFFPDESISDTLTYTFDRVNVINHGGKASGLNNSNRFFSVSQMFWKPYSWDALGSKIISFDNVGVNELNENTMGNFALSLRTTQESTGGAGPALRPLVDANVRAMLNNTRWDSPLELNVLAAYNMENDNELDGFSDQIPEMNTVDNPKGYAYWGSGRDSGFGFDRVLLFDIPRQDLVSLGQLQHANVGRFSYEPTYIIGNSYANLRIPQDEWRASVSDTLADRVEGPNESIPGNFNLYDSSYLVNEVLWDSYTFTTIPQVADNHGSAAAAEADPDETLFESLAAGDEVLPNPRYIPYVPAGSKFDIATLHQTTPDGEETGGFHHNAGHVMVDGAFNVNSTSVDAWEAFLSGTHQLPYLKIDENGTVTGFETDVDGARFPRVQASFGGPTDRENLDENYWTGFRSLEQSEVRELAEAIVEEVRKRGPFLTMAEFVNRKLESGELGERGTLQAALDATVNKDLDSSFESDASHPDIPDNSTQGAGFPGQLLQGDILQALAPYMGVRSDTFTIRAYGEARSADGGTVLARAWCEATVQRYPDPVDNPQSGGDALSELANPSSGFGRRFRIISFRWLNQEEI